MKKMILTMLVTGAALMAQTAEYFNARHELNQAQDLSNRDQASSPCEEVGRGRGNQECYAACRDSVEVAIS